MTDATRSYRWFVITLYVPVFFMTIGFGIVSPVLPLFAEHFDVSFAAVSLLLSAVGMARIVTDIPLAIAVDKYGRRPLAVLGPLAGAVGALVSGFAGSFPILLAGRIISGVGMGISFAASQTIIADMAQPSDRGKIMNSFVAFNFVGFATGPVIGGFSASLWGFNAPFFLTAALCFISGVLAYAEIPETKPQSSVVPGWRNLGKVLREVRRSAIWPTFVSVAIGVSAISFRFGARQTLIPLYANLKLGIDIAGVGVILGLVDFLNLITITPSGKIMDRYGRKSVYVPGQLISAMAYALIPFTHNFVAIAAVSLILGFGTGIVGGSIVVMATDISPEESRGAFLGMFRLIQDFSLTISPIVLGALTDMFGFLVPFYVTAFYVLFASLSILIFGKETLQAKRRNPPP